MPARLLSTPADRTSPTSRAPPTTGCPSGHRRSGRQRHLGLERLRQARFDPGGDVVDHLVPAEIVEQIVIMAVIELEGLVGRAGLVEELLAAVGSGRLVGGAVEDEYGQRDTTELALEPFAGAGEG